MESADTMSKHSVPSVGSLSLKPVEKVWIEESNTVRLRLSIDANYKVTGRNSGQEYLFRGAGSEVDVKKEDVEFLLSIRQGKGCCGGGGGNPVFELT